MVEPADVAQPQVEAHGVHLSVDALEGARPVGKLDDCVTRGFEPRSREPARDWIVLDDRHCPPGDFTHCYPLSQQATYRPERGRHFSALCPYGSVIRAVPRPRMRQISKNESQLET